MHATCVKVNSGVIAVQTREGTHIFDLRCGVASLLMKLTHLFMQLCLFVCVGVFIHRRTNQNLEYFVRVCVYVLLVGYIVYVHMFLCLCVIINY